MPLFEGILDLARGRQPAPWLKPSRPLLMYRYWEECFRQPGAAPGKEG